MFAVPFPEQINPQLAAARVEHERWLADSDLVRSAEGWVELAGWDLPQATARTFPHARMPQLVHLMNFFVIGFLFDDQADPGDPDRLGQITAVAQEMVMTTFREPGTPLSVACPVTVSFQQVWRRMIMDMSPAWLDRFAADYARWAGRAPR